jgi:hypothetical protein
MLRRNYNAVMTTLRSFEELGLFFKMAYNARDKGAYSSRGDTYDE